jgi:hypothetical protein
MSRAQTYNKVAREVIQQFKDSGLEVEIVAGTKHYLVYHRGEQVYKFGQGTKRPGWAMVKLDALIRRLQKVETTGDSGSTRG